MKKRLLICLCALTLLLSACAPQSALPQVESTDAVAEMVAAMSMREKIGQMMMLDFRTWKMSGGSSQNLTALNEEVAGLIRDYSLGNVILFSENCETSQQVAALTAEFQSAVTNGIPMFVAIDQEGGTVTRLAEGCATAGSMALGAAGLDAHAWKSGDLIGAELKALGINVDFAPSLDVNSNPQNPVIGLRSFGSDPSDVARLGKSFVSGLHHNGVIAAVKHYPGHGDTATDSHTGLPTVDRTYEELLEQDLLPFRETIQNNVPMVMSAHIQYPKVETETAKSTVSGESITLPATLSWKFLTEILRGELGFQGVAVTDSMEMKAISAHFTEPEAVTRAINAGADLLLMPTGIHQIGDLQKLEDIYKTVETHVINGGIAQARIDEAVTRILSLKMAMGLFEQGETPSIDSIGSAEHRKTEREIAAAAVTVLKNEDSVLPFLPKKGESMLYLAPYDNETPSFVFAVKRLYQEGKVEDFDYVSYCYNGQGAISDELAAHLEQADYVVMITENGGDFSAEKWSMLLPLEVIDYAKEHDKKLAVISAALPYELALYQDAPALVAVYGAKGMQANMDADKSFGVNIPAGIEAVLGGAPARGRLPVEVMRVRIGQKKASDEVVYPRGSGIDLN